MKSSIKDFFGKCDQIRRFLKKSITENFINCAVIRFAFLVAKLGNIKEISKLVSGRG